MSEYTPNELRQFDRLTLALSSQNQMDRIRARFQLPKFVARHGKEKCEAMFKVLRARDAKTP